MNEPPEVSGPDGIDEAFPDPLPPESAAPVPPSRRVLLPARGIVCAHNHRGRPLHPRDLVRWLYLNRVVFKAEKCDLLVHGPVPPAVTEWVHTAAAEPGGEAAANAQALMMPLSLRTDCPAEVPALDALKAAGLFDLLLAPRGLEDESFRAWLESAAAAELPARVQVQPRFSAAFDPEAFARTLADAAVPVLTIVNDDPFQPRPPCSDETDARRTVDLMNALAEAAQAEGIETNLYGLPVALVSKANTGIAGGRRRFFLDHQQYQKASCEWAERLYRRSPRMAALAIAAYLGRYTSVRNLPDEVILRFAIAGDRHALIQALAVAAKFVRRWRLWPFAPEQRMRHDEDLAASIARLKDNGYGLLGAEFDALRTPDAAAERRENRAFERLMPGLAVETAPQDSRTLWNGLASQHKHFDAIDTARMEEDADAQRLSEEAARVVQSREPDRPVPEEAIRPANALGVGLPGAFRWHTLVDREVQSGPLYEGGLPFTVECTVGGGIADFAGFSIWDAIKVVCPMQAYAHVLTLHADRDGRFVLLRDGVPVRPVQFEGKFHTPRRLPARNEVRASIWNINTDISIHNARVWTGNEAGHEDTAEVRHSILIVSTRYARRLQAVLAGIAHQDGAGLEHIEVIVGYVPGIDATEDVLASFEAAHPALRIVRSPFPERRMNAKGFIINQSLKLARGQWVTLLDSDIVLPPGFFAQLDALPAECRFAAPQGRKMLPREVTARILLGEARPWQDWEALLDGPGEERYGDRREGGPDTPIGFCQCVRRECFETVQYNEYDNFEGADWEFATALRDLAGGCHFLDVPVLHLDHGGSQWYGARRHQ